MVTKRIASALRAASLAPIPAARLPAERNSLILNAACQLSGQSGSTGPAPSPAPAQSAVLPAFWALE